MRKRMWFMGICVFLLLPLLFMWGCGGGKKEVAGPGGDPIGDPIIIGSALPVAFSYGWVGERGIRLAVEEINAAGGVNVGGVMRPFKVEVIDTRDLEAGVPVSEALLAVEKLILEKKAHFLVGGPARTEALLPTLDLVNKHEIIHISSTGSFSPRSNQMVKDDYEKYKFHFKTTCWTFTMLGDFYGVLDSLKEEHGFNKIAVMVQDVAHARQAGEIVSKRMAEKGWDVMDPIIYPTGTLDYSDGLLRARKFGAQVLFVWMDMPESVIMMRQYRDMQIPAIPIGFINAAEHPDFWNATEGKGEYTLNHLVNSGNAPAVVTPLTMPFVEAYKARWGVEPEGYGASSSYQAIYTLKDAIERAGTIETYAVLAALEATDMEGVYGRVRFDPETHLVMHSLDPAEGAVPQIIQWLDGKRETVFPPSIATKQLQLPPWMN
ncbi:MAG: ABC transporter substrate-binding protein [Bacillota bacterium]